MINNLPNLADYGTHDESRFPELWEGCVGAWAPCLGPTGIRLHDFSRRPNWGTLTSMDAATDWAVSGGRYSLDLDGTNDVIDYGSNVVLAGATQVSFSAWVWRAAQGAFLVFTRYSSGTTPNRTDYFGTNNVTLNGQISLSIGNASANVNNDYLFFNSTEQMVASSWNHIAATCTIAGNSSTCNMWLNGVPATVNASHGGTRPTSWGANNTVSYVTGRITGFFGTNAFYSGTFDDLRVYNRLLSHDEVVQLSRGRGIAYQRRLRKPYFEIDSTVAFRAAWAKRPTQLIGGGTY